MQKDFVPAVWNQTSLGEILLYRTTRSVGAEELEGIGG